MSSPPDSSAIDNAVIGRLLADPSLAALMPDGVYYGHAGAGARRYVIVSLIGSIDESTFDGRAIEHALYLVKAVALSTTGGDVQTAAARIDALLQDQFFAIAPGYDLMAAYRIGDRLREKELDDVDPDLVWNHRGATYRLDVAVTAPRTLSAPGLLARGIDHLERVGP